MTDFGTGRTKRSLWHIVWSLVVGGLLLLILGTGYRGLAQTGSWSEPINISHTPAGSWFPDLVVDSKGNVHIVWCETVRREGARLLDERVYTAIWDGHEWSDPNDIVPSNPDINRNALAIDGLDNLYLTFRYHVSGGIGIHFMQAPADRAWSAASWTKSRLVNVRANSYMSDLAVDEQGVVHLVFDDKGVIESEICLDRCTDLYYRRSKDQGQTWSYPVNLSRSPAGVSREQIEIGNQGTIHVTWDDGWDRVSGAGEAVSASYTFSTDGGETWDPITSVTYPTSTVAQLAVGSDGHEGVMLVWRTTSTDDIYYQWSPDNRRFWEAPAAIPQIFARPWDTPYDMYDMAVDSNGHIHLLVVGRESLERDALLGVYHLIWDGGRWSIPTRIFATEGMYPEYPKIVVYRGNQLHAAWFTREGSMWEEVNREIWYSSSQSSAPYQQVTPLPTFTLVPSTPTPLSIPTATPYPTVSFDHTGLPDRLRTESDDVLRLAVALLPIVLVILVVVVIKMGWFSNLRR